MKLMKAADDDYRAPGSRGVARHHSIQVVTVTVRLYGHIQLYAVYE